MVIVDQSEPFNRKFYNGYKVNINAIHQENPALWQARNTGVNTSNADYFLFLDDDSRIDEDFIYSHLKCIDYFDAHVSSGISLNVDSDRITPKYSFFRWADQLDTGNVMIKREVFEKCGLFDEKFDGMRMGDFEFCIRAYLQGFKNISNPTAKRVHLKYSSGGLRDFGSWDAFRPINIFSPRPVPSVLYLYRKYWGEKTAFFYTFIITIFSLSPYKLKGKYSGYMISVILFILFFPIVILHYYRSWNISTRLLKSNINIKLLK